MYYKKNDKGQYWTGVGWSFSKAQCKYYEVFDDVANTPKEGKIQMVRPDNKDVFDAIQGICGDNGIIMKSWSITKAFYNLEWAELSIRIHWNKSNEGFSVGTKLNHPVQKVSTLWRNYCTLEDVKRILLNPREHIGLPTQRVKN